MISFMLLCVKFNLSYSACVGLILGKVVLSTKIYPTNSLVIIDMNRKIITFDNFLYMYACVKFNPSCCERVGLILGKGVLSTKIYPANSFVIIDLAISYCSCALECKYQINLKAHVIH